MQITPFPTGVTRRRNSPLSRAALASVLLAGLSLTLSAPSARAESLTKSKAAAAAVQARCDAALRAHAARNLGRGWVSVIVRVGGGQGLSPEQEGKLAGLQADIYRRLPIIGAAGCRVPNRNLKALAALPFVERVSLDLEVSKCDEQVVETTGADRAYEDYGLSGQGVGVAILDTGIDRHPDFGGPRARDRRVVAEVNFVPGERRADDECGHGTHIAGIVAGDGSASTGRNFYRTFYGVARGANLVDVRVLDDRGRGNVSTVIAGINWIVNNRQRHNIRVLNVSFGHEVGEGYRTDPLCLAAEAAWKSGIVVVCAAGNGGRLNPEPTTGGANGGYGTRYGSVQSPANSPYVITVGAMKPGPSGGRSQHQIATYSSRGPSRLDFVLKPDLVAPGEGVVSTLANGSYLDRAFSGANQVALSEYRDTNSERPSNRYLRLSGTSMAAPVVAGAAALLIQREPWLTPDTVKARLMITADKWAGTDGAADACTYGAGYLNIPAALAARFSPTTPAVSPELIRMAEGGVYVVTDQLLSVTSPGPWGASAGIVDATQAIWGGNAVGQAGRLAGPTIGDQPVWGDQGFGIFSVTSVDLSAIAVRGDRR